MSLALFCRRRAREDGRFSASFVCEVSVCRHAQRWTSSRGPLKASRRSISAFSNAEVARALRRRASDQPMRYRARSSTLPPFMCQDLWWPRSSSGPGDSSISSARAAPTSRQCCSACRARSSRPPPPEHTVVSPGPDGALRTAVLPAGSAIPVLQVLNSR